MQTPRQLTPAMAHRPVIPRCVPDMQAFVFCACGAKL